MRRLAGRRPSVPWAGSVVKSRHRVTDADARPGPSDSELFASRDRAEGEAGGADVFPAVPGVNGGVPLAG